MISQWSSPYAGIKISTSWGYLAVVLGCGLMMLRCVGSIIGSAVCLKNGRPELEEGGMDA